MLQDQVGISEAFQTEICSPTQACLSAPNPFLQLLRPQALEQTWFLPLSHHIQSIHKPVGFNFRVDSCLCPSLLSLAQASSTYCLDGGKCLLKRSPYSQQVPHTVYVYHSSQGDPMKTRVTTRFCAEPKPRSCRGHLRPLAPATPAPEHWTVSTSRPVQSRTFSVLFPLCSLLYPQHLRGKLGTPSTQWMNWMRMHPVGHFHYP